MVKDTNVKKEKTEKKEPKDDDDDVKKKEVKDDEVKKKEEKKMNVDDEINGKKKEKKEPEDDDVKKKEEKKMDIDDEINENNLNIATAKDVKILTMEPLEITKERNDEKELMLKTRSRTRSRGRSRGKSNEGRTRRAHTVQQRISVVYNSVKFQVSIGRRFCILCEKDRTLLVLLVIGMGFALMFLLFRAYTDNFLHWDRDYVIYFFILAVLCWLLALKFIGKQCLSSIAGVKEEEKFDVKDDNETEDKKSRTNLDFRACETWGKKQKHIIVSSLILMVNIIL